MDTVDDILEHYGVKGMKWGHRKAETDRPPAHSDAIKAKEYKSRAKRGSVDALSTAELQELVQRQNLERQFSSLNPSATKKGTKIVADILLNAGKQQAARAVNDYVGRKVGDLTKK